jgi:hypothetical protein
MKKKKKKKRNLTPTSPHIQNLFPSKLKNPTVKVKTKTWLERFR